MIGGEQVYKVVTAMLPLYTGIILGYASIHWWHMFKPDHCRAINRFNCYFIMPFFTFQFISNVNPYAMNFRFIAADLIAKAMIGVVLVGWATFSRNGSFSWLITNFSLLSLNSALFVGVPLLQAMYGDQGSDLAIQSSVIQALMWFICLQFMLEMRRAQMTSPESDYSDHPTGSENIEAGVTTAATNTDGQHGNHIQALMWLIYLQFVLELRRGQIAMPARESNLVHRPAESENIEAGVTTETNTNTVSDNCDASGQSSCGLMKMVVVRVTKNPNSYACIVGLIWALISKRWHFGMPKLVDGSILMMSKGGAGLAMFTMGLFMALQEKLVACGMDVALYSLALRFVIGPATTAVGAAITGLHGDAFRIAILQAALPEALSAFTYHQEYGLHAQVLSTAVIIGTAVSLPLLIGYYAVLDVLY